jgi:hypothetical protein
LETDLRIVGLIPFLVELDAAAKMIRFKQAKEYYGKANIDALCQKSRRDCASDVEITVSGSFRYPWMIVVLPIILSIDFRLSTSANFFPLAINECYELDSCEDAKFFPR